MSAPAAVSSLTDPTVPAEFLDLANRLADASGAVIRKYFRTSLTIDDKADDSPVTIADQGRRGSHARHDRRNVP